MVLPLPTALVSLFLVIVPQPFLLPLVSRGSLHQEVYGLQVAGLASSRFFISLVSEYLLQSSSLGQAPRYSSCKPVLLSFTALSRL